MDEARSLFDNFGGHYSVKLDGIEVARFAPSNFWTEFINQWDGVQGLTYDWVSTDL